MRIVSLPADTARKVYRVVIVEDQPIDARLMLEQLSRAELHVESQVVCRKDDFTAALIHFKPELILSDSHMPCFSGMRAFELAQQLVPEVPFILVTGYLSEEEAIDCLRAGVTDYVLKDQLLRLGPCVASAIERANDRRAILLARSESRRQDRRFRALAEAAGDALIIVDERGDIVFLNPAAESTLGYSKENVIGGPVSMLIPEELWSQYQAAFSKLREGRVSEQSLRPTSEALRADGTRIPVEISISTWNEGDDWFAAASLRDMSDLVATRMRQVRLSTAIDQSTDLVIITDKLGTVEYTNAAFTTITGYSADEVRGRSLQALCTPKQDVAISDAWMAKMFKGRHWRNEFVTRRKDGTEYRQLTNIYPIMGTHGTVDGYVAIGQDVTRKRKLEDQLRHAQKLETVGQLTSGIAHDINNVLAVILTNGHLIKVSLDEDSPVHESLADIVSAAERAADLIRKLMVFTRHEHLDLELVDLREVLSETGRLLACVLPENIELRLDEPQERVTVLLDPSAMQQILLNLATNARDAMPDGGRLDIRVKARACSELNDIPGPQLNEEVIVVEVKDSGEGIDPADVRRIFDPFFTTKPSGKGTGLGLSMVYGLTHSLGGTITVDSKLGVGTKFQLSLPRHAEPGPSAKGRSASESTISGGSETILFVDDEAPLRRSAGQALSQLGYNVLLAEDGSAGLALLRRHGQQIDLVVSDLVMPTLGGVGFYEAAQDLDSAPPFLFVSGYPPEDGGRSGILGGPALLRKPWNVGDLAAAVREALHARVSKGEVSS